TAIAHIAVYQLGAVTVPLSFLFGPDALEYRIVNSEAKVAFVDPQSLPNFAPIREHCPGVSTVVGVAGARETWVTPFETLIERGSPDHACADTAATDAAVIVYTSGTTG